MLPLLQKANANGTKLDTTQSKSRGKVLCVAVVLIFVALIAILSYFNFGSADLAGNNPAKALYQNEPSTEDSIGSEYYKSSGYNDQVLSMPNLDETTCSSSVTNCAFKQYSGYLLANDNREIHYWFMEADTTDDPTTKPLFFWTNGGPGCSGMDGLLTEHGPWRVMDNLDIHYNPYTWTTEVNMVYLEQPYGVGFSKATDDNVVAGDQNSADDMDAAIRSFLSKFPEYADNRVYLSAESWGGHYVPITTYTILQNNAAELNPHINFGGFLLGNPYTDWYENTYGFVGDIYGHGLMMSKDWDEWRATCWDNAYNIDNNPVCSAIYTRAYLSSYNSNVYALDWPQCLVDEDWSAHTSGAITRSKHQRHRHLHRHAQIFMKRVLDHSDYEGLKMRTKREDLLAMYNELMNKQTYDVEAMTAESVSSDAYLPCIEYNMANWLNLDDVQTALNVKTVEWNMCSDAVWNEWPQSDYDTFIQPFYDNIIREYGIQQDLKLCVYSGDDDSVCGLQGTQYWLDRWDGYEANPDVEWSAWEDESNELGGYYTQYMRQNDEHNNVGLHFMTVRTAGHMVPTTEPQRALTLLRKFLYEF
eukprot:382616_1